MNEEDRKSSDPAHSLSDVERAVRLSLLKNSISLVDSKSLSNDESGDFLDSKNRRTAITSSNEFKQKITSWLVPRDRRLASSFNIIKKQRKVGKTGSTEAAKGSGEMWTGDE
jgi:hypothetical protein